MKGKYWVAIVSALFACTALVFGSVYSNKRNEKIASSYVLQTDTSENVEEVTDEEILEDELPLLTEEINRLYTNETHTFLADSVTIESITPIRMEVDNLPDGPEKDELSNQIDEASRKLAIQTSLNSLYNEPILHGETINENATLNELTTEIQIMELFQSVSEQSTGDAFYEQVLAILNPNLHSEEVVEPL